MDVHSSPFRCSYVGEVRAKLREESYAPSPFRCSYLPPAWTEPTGPLLELPGVEYPRKLRFPTGRHSLVLVRTKRSSGESGLTTGIKWALVEDASLPRIESSLLRLILGCEKDDIGVIEVFPLETIGIPPSLVYRHIAFEEKISRYVKKNVYNYSVVRTLNERLEETHQAIDAYIALYLPAVCDLCKAQTPHAY